MMGARLLKEVKRFRSTSAVGMLAAAPTPSGMNSPFRPRFMHTVIVPMLREGRLC